MNSLISMAIACFAMLTTPSSIAIPQKQTASKDVATLDGIIQAYYEVVSGPAGQPRQWARDRSLHHPAAQIVIVRNNDSGQMTAHAMSLADYHQQSSHLAQQGFFEYEIHRETSTHGPIAHIWSTYEWRITKGGPVGGRGINSIQLIHDGSRWWITSWMFDGRNNAPPVPARYLPKGDQQ